MDKISDLLTECLEFLIVKKKQAELVLEFIRERKSRSLAEKYRVSYTEKEIDIQENIKYLNKRS